MIIALVPLLAALIGLLMYFVCTNPKVVELGRTLMWCGILITLVAAMNHVVTVG